jgi:hypothetical protein
VSGCFGHGYEPSTLMKGEEFLDQLSVLSASQERRCLGELVTVEVRHWLTA